MQAGTELEPELINIEADIFTRPKQTEVDQGCDGHKIQASFKKMLFGPFPKLARAVSSRGALSRSSWIARHDHERHG
jgi:hypothetical protein